MKKRKIYLTGLFLGMILILSACGSKENNGSTQEESDTYYWNTGEEVSSASEEKSTSQQESSKDHSQESSAEVATEEETTYVFVEETEEPSTEEEYDITPLFTSLQLGSNNTQRVLVWEATYNDGEYVRLYDTENWDDTRDFPGNERVTPDGKAVNYTALLTSLEYGKKYAYEIRRGEECSAMNFFTVGEQSNTFEFLLAGDPQIGSMDTYEDVLSWRRSVSRMMQISPDAEFLFSVGDQVDMKDNKNQFDGFMDIPVLHSIPLGTVPGNHEVGSKYYETYFAMENNPVTKNFVPNDYAFTWGDSLFLCLNTNNTDNLAHKTFMQDQIKKYETENRKSPRWVIAIMHHSIFSITDHLEAEAYEKRQSQMAPVFSELGVDVVFMGHDHVYNRTFLMDGTSPQIVKDASGQRPREAVSKDGLVMYFTLNSASGSKFYEQVNIGKEIAHNNQEEIPNMTHVEVNEGSIVVTTHRMTDGSKVDQFILYHD